jgi:predicted TIM-barrel fold metal-dependent hydrolase
MTSRRDCLGALAGAISGSAVLQAAPAGLLIDTHVHLFDPTRFPYAPLATYKPPAQPLEPYAAFVRQAGIAHTIVVHPEPYQDDHRYLEYCFQHEPSPGFFKGTCLFDPIAPDTPARMEALVKKLPGRIVALRIHENHKPGTPPTASGAIRDRDMTAPAMRETWGKAHALGLAIQMHFIPYYAPQIGALAERFPQMPVILDHLARAGQGTPDEYGQVLKLARLPRVYMKFSAVQYSSKAGYPYRDVQPLVRRTFDAFGSNRIIWGGLGMNMADFEKNTAVFEEMFAFASGADRAKIRGQNAARLFQFPS